MYISLDPQSRQAFLIALARQADPPFSLGLNGDWLELRDLPAASAARALVWAVFPRYEQEQLERLARENFSHFDSARREWLVETALALIVSDSCHGVLVSGPRRWQRLEQLLTLTLEQEQRLDFQGFCRFRLKGYAAYLRYVLDLAADELLARDESEDCLRLLAATAASRPHGPELKLEFFPGGGYSLSGHGLTEGGRWREREDMLLANLISLGPTQVELSGRAFAPLQITSLLEQIFGSRLRQIDGGEKLDKPPTKCYDD